jgi:hypothetical protein
VIEQQPQDSTSFPIDRQLLARDLDLLGRSLPTLLPLVAQAGKFLPLDLRQVLPSILARALALSDDDLVLLIDELARELGAIRRVWPGASSASPEVQAALVRLGKALS